VDEGFVWEIVHEIGWNIRVVVFLIDHINLRPGRKLHIVVRALQACESRMLSMHMQDPIHGYRWRRRGQGR